LAGVFIRSSPETADKGRIVVAPARARIVAILLNLVERVARPLIPDGADHVLLVKKTLAAPLRTREPRPAEAGAMIGRDSR